MENTDLIYGLHAVTEALNGDLVNKLYVQEDLRGKNVEKIKELARLKKVNISWTPKTELNKLTENGVPRLYGKSVRICLCRFRKDSPSISREI